MSEIIGIDLGLTISRMARLVPSGRPEIVHNDDGGNLTPSAVEVTGPDRSGWVVGGEAKRKLFGADTRALGGFKRYMGKGHSYDTAAGPITPTDLSAAVLSSLRRQAEKKGPIGRAVVTVPANFGTEARVATTEAANLAGLHAVHLVNEPTAAALYYAQEQGGDVNGHFAVFDLGGGTFDVTVLKLEGKEVSILATDGIEKLGGLDFDLALQKLVHRLYQEKAGDSCSDEYYDLLTAEDDKKSLSKCESKRIWLRGDAGAHIIDVQRSQYEAEISASIAQMELLCENVLEDAGLSKGELDGTLLLGGETRIPAVQRVAARALGCEPTIFSDPSEVVALGAALYAGYRAWAQLTNAEPESALEGMFIQERTMMAYGMIIPSDHGGAGEGGSINRVVIPRLTCIPCQASFTLFTVEEGQTAMHLEVTECSSNELDLEFVKVIWRGELPLAGGRPRGHPVHATYSIDSQQLVSCSFRDSEDGEELEVDLGRNESAVRPGLEIQGDVEWKGPAQA